jgi:hypothetical protein
MEYVTVREGRLTREDEGHRTGCDDGSRQLQQVHLPYGMAKPWRVAI